MGSSCTKYVNVDWEFAHPEKEPPNSTSSMTPKEALTKSGA
jgi:hypothetical protein